MYRLDRLSLVGCVLVGVIVGVAQATGYLTDPFDAHMYWDAGTGPMYPVQWNAAGGYVYPPPMALVIGVLHPIGWPLFIFGFTVATWWAFWYLTRAFALPVLLGSWALFPFIGGNVIGYLFMGNVQLIMAAAIVASIRVSPAWSAVPVLTKLVGIPLLWFAVRREWHSLLVAVGTVAAIVGLSLLLAPASWEDFVRFSLSDPLSTSPVPMVPIAYPVRLILAVGLTVWGALTDRRWTVMVASGLAIPALYQWSFLALWVGVIGIEWDTKKPAPAEARAGLVWG